MTRPETCGAAGGAISVWFRIIDCTVSHPDAGGSGGVISTFTHALKTTGVSVACTNSVIKCVMDFYCFPVNICVL